ncbi:MAG: TM2 domain-containing protein [Bacteroidia bacterium]|nr:TM2 domain-containing protein [Bacteroidia bacterium]
MRKPVLLGLLCLLCFPIFSESLNRADSSDSEAQACTLTEPMADSVKFYRRQKLKAALLAFPLIGITGAHRVFLGTEPYMPLVYLATVGGFGILPLVDFVVILATPPRELNRFRNSEKVFMWAH